MWGISHLTSGRIKHKAHAGRVGLSAYLPAIHLISKTMRGRENNFLHISFVGTVQNDAFRCCRCVPLSFEKSQSYVIVRNSVLIQHYTHTHQRTQHGWLIQRAKPFFPPMCFNQLEAFEGEKKDNSTQPRLICLRLWHRYVSNTMTKHTGVGREEEEWWQDTPVCTDETELTSALEPRYSDYSINGYHSIILPMFWLIHMVWIFRQLWIRSRCLPTWGGVHYCGSQDWEWQRCEWVNNSDWFSLRWQTPLEPGEGAVCLVSSHMLMNVISLRI